MHRFLYNLFFWIKQKCTEYHSFWTDKWHCPKPSLPPQNLHVIFERSLFKPASVPVASIPGSPGDPFSVTMHSRPCDPIWISSESETRRWSIVLCDTGQTVRSMHALLHQKSEGVEINWAFWWGFWWGGEILEIGFVCCDFRNKIFGLGWKWLYISNWRF